VGRSLIIQLIDINEEFEGLQEVTSPRIFYRNKFDAHGLFSEQIFGCAEDYKCQCGRYYGKEYLNIVCENCGVTVTNSDARLYTFAKITIPDITVLINPFIMEMLTNVVKIQDIKLDEIIIGKQKVVIENDHIHRSSSDNAKYGPIFFKEELLPLLLSQSKKLKEFYNKYKKYLFIKYIPVIPPDTRPISTGGSSKQYFIDEVNEYYLRIIRRISNMKTSPFIPEYAHAALQKDVNALFNILLGKFESKRGFLRSYVLGKRVDYSGRAVITIDGSDMPLGYCKIPYKIAKEIYKPNIIPIVSEKTQLTPLQVLIDYEKEELKPIIKETLKEKFIGEYVLINRQPTLHRGSIQSMKIYDIIDDDVIVIHPLITEVYNADFDGDQMAIYAVHTLSRPEAKSKMFVDNNIKLPSNGEISLKFKQDMVLGLHTLTQDVDDESKIIFLNEKTTPERVNLFKEVMPNKYHKSKEIFSLFNTVLNKKNIEILISNLEKKLSKSEWLNVVDKLCKIGFEHSHSTLSLNDFVVNGSMESLKNNATEMIRSGARGSWDQFKQIAVSKGFVSDVTGRIIPKEIKNSLLNGLTPEEYFISAYGGRKGLIDTAENTAKSGYLTRKMVYLLSPLVLDKKIKDCHKELNNTKYFELYVRDERIAKLLMGRYTKEYGLITDPSLIVNKVINLRSPIACTAPGICQTCYGHLFNIHKSHNIGIIAAQSLGERTTQLTLRTKHTSGSVDAQLGKLDKYLSIVDNILVAKEKGTVRIYNDENIEFNFNDESYFLNDYESFELLPSCQYKEYDDYKEVSFNAGDKIANVELTVRDIVSAVNMVASILNKPDDSISLQDYLYNILDIYDIYASIDLVHFECILAMLARDEFNYEIPYRKSDNNYKLLGINKVISNMPEQALAFERFSYYLKKFIGNEESVDTKEENSLLRSLLFFEFN